MTILENGQLVNHDSVQVGTESNLWRGKGWFETVAVYDGQAYNLNSHLNRLMHSLPEAATKKIKVRSLSEKIAELINEENPDRERLKLVVWTEGEEFHYAAWLNEYNPPSKNKYRDGIDLKVQLRSHPPRWPLTEQKRTNYASPLAERNQTDAWDVLFCDLDGKVWETSISNILWFDDGVLYYPPQDGHLLSGTVLKESVQKAESIGIDVKAKSDLWDNLGEFCWLTNSLIGMLPVRKIGNTIYAENYLPTAWLELRDALLSDKVFPRWHESGIY